MLILLGAGGWSFAFADEPGPQGISASGFGTLGAVHSSESRADFTANTTQGGGAGATHRLSADVDTVIAGQLTANLTPQLSAVVQVVSERNYDRTYRPHAEWANVKYQVDPDFSLRAGRIALPLFLATDSRKIGYANPWVRPPPEVYNLTPFTNSDGADAIYRMPIGDATATIHATIGRTTLRIPRPPPDSHGTGEVRSLYTLVYKVERGPVVLQLNYAHGRFTIPEFAGAFDAFEQLGAAGQAIARKYRVANSPVTSTGVSASYDPGDWFVTGELGRNDTHSLLGASTGWYITGGYRIGRFTPYATVARMHGDGNTADPGVPLAGLPDAAVPTALALNGFLNAILRSKPAQTSYSIGARWELAKSAALKLQFDRLLTDAHSPGVLTNLQPDFMPARGSTC